MKKPLAALLSALILFSPLSSYAQSVPQIGGAGRTVVLPIGTTGTGVQMPGAGASAALSTQGSTLQLPTGVQPVQIIPAAQTNASAVAMGGVKAASVAGTAKTQVAAGRTATRKGAVAQAVQAQQAEEKDGPASSLVVAQRLAAELGPNVAAPDASARSANFFDALRRMKGPQASAAEEAPEAEPAKPSGSSRFLQAIGRQVAGSMVAGLLPASVVTKLNGGEAAVPAPKNSDEFGGPKAESLSTRDQVLKGLKWALNLVGITSILSWTLGTLQASIAWPLLLPEFLLKASGRVELLTQFGPQAILESLAQSPISFLFFQVPMSIASETWSYQLLGFGTSFLTLAAIKPIANWVSEKMTALPDLFSFRTIATRFLGAAAKISAYAFPLAAINSAFSFSMAHMAEWGANPLVLVAQAVAGYLLVRLAYTARPSSNFPEIGKGSTARLRWAAKIGVHLARFGIAPFVAHVTFAILTLIAPLLSVHQFGGSAGVVSTLLSITGIVALYTSTRLHFKAKIPTAALSALLAVTLAWQGAGMLPGKSIETAKLMDGRPAVVKMQDADPHAPPQALPPGLLEMLEKIQGGEAAAVQLPDLPLPELIKAVKPAVVTVMVGGGLGSGVVVDQEGLIVTNEHVTHDVGVGGKVKIKFADGRIVPGIVLGMNQERDLALVALPPNPEGWPSAPMAPPGTLEEGQTVFTMGSPLGLPFTVSKGIVSGLGFRGIGPTYRVQIDAPISHGNSGGPLFDEKGRVVGINGAGIPSGGDLNFSIPIEEVHRAIAQYKATGEIRSSYLGLIFELGEKMGEGPGVTIEHVRPGSPAHRSGLQSGDVIVGADGKGFPAAPMGAMNQLFLMLGSKNPTEQLALMVLRPQASGMPKPTIVIVTLDAK